VARTRRFQGWKGANRASCSCPIDRRTVAVFSGAGAYNCIPHFDFRAWAISAFTLARPRPPLSARPCRPWRRSMHNVFDFVVIPFSIATWGLGSSLGLLSVSHASKSSSRPNTTDRSPLIPSLVSVPIFVLFFRPFYEFSFLSFFLFFRGFGHRAYPNPFFIPGTLSYGWNQSSSPMRRR
jgi:hypothetical protein